MMNYFPLWPQRQLIPSWWISIKLTQKKNSVKSAAVLWCWELIEIKNEVDNHEALSGLNERFITRESREACRPWILKFINWSLNSERFSGYDRVAIQWIEFTFWRSHCGQRSAGRCRRNSTAGRGRWKRFTLSESPKWSLITISKMKMHFFV